MLSTFLLVVVGWVFFRAESISQAFKYLHIMFVNLLSTPNFNGQNSLLLIILFMIIIEWLNRNFEFGLDIRRIKHKWIRHVIYILLLFTIFSFGGKSETFIYFQF